MIPIIYNPKTDEFKTIAGTIISSDSTLRQLIPLIKSYSKPEDQTEPLKIVPSDILIKAAETIKQRGVQRDLPDGERSMARCVAAFNSLYGKDLTETEGWNFMSILKLSRAAGRPYCEDDMLDCAAYAALAAESKSEGK